MNIKQTTYTVVAVLIALFVWNMVGERITDKIS